MAEQFCPQCGAKNAGDASFCEACGQSLQAAAAAPPPAQPAWSQPAPAAPVRKRSMSPAVMAIVVLLIGAGGVMALKKVRGPAPAEAAAPAAAPTQTATGAAPGTTPGGAAQAGTPMETGTPNVAPAELTASTPSAPPATIAASPAVGAASSGAPASGGTMATTPTRPGASVPQTGSTPTPQVATRDPGVNTKALPVPTTPQAQQQTAPRSPTANAGGAPVPLPPVRETSVTTPPPPPPPVARIPAGTVLTLTAAGQICTDQGKVGDELRATVQQDVDGINGARIPKGSVVTFVVDQLAHPQGQPVAFSIAAKSIEANGASRPLSASIDTLVVKPKGRGLLGAVVGAAAAAATAKVAGAGTGEAVAAGAVGGAAGAIIGSQLKQGDGCIERNSPMRVRLTQDMTPG